MFLMLHSDECYFFCSILMFSMDFCYYVLAISSAIAFDHVTVEKVNLSDFFVDLSNVFKIFH